jgi:hypothetical protein
MITFKGRFSNGLMVLEVKEDDKVEEKTCIGVRCGLSWPMALNPGGYFCLVAQGAKKNITGEYPLMVIREFKALTMTSLFEKMFDEMGVFGCFEIFVDPSPRFATYIKALDSYKSSKRELQPAEIKPAPYFESFLHGNDMIGKWIKVIKGLTIPKDFIIRSQLREIRESDLKGEPQEKFFAMNALRYVLAAFETSAIPESMKDRAVEAGLPPGAWT